MKKFEIPQTVLNATDKCPHDYSCLDTGHCVNSEDCLEDYSCGKKRILYLKDSELSSVCPYRNKYECKQVCLCPTKLYLHQQRIDGDIIFKQCMRCKATWKDYSDFLSDPSVSLRAYQMSFVEQETGVFLFEHSCKTTLAIPAGDFSHLYDGPIFKENPIGQNKKPSYCMRSQETGLCPEKCECEYIAEVIQIINKWPKAH